MDLFAQTQQQHQAGNFEQALAGYQALLADDQDNPQLNYLLALLFFEKGKLEEAAHWFSRVVILAPDAAPAHYNLGVIFFEQGDYSKAAQAYEEAAKLCPEDGDIFFNLALTRKKLGQFDKAFSCYQKVLAITPDAEDVLYNLGVLCKDLHHHADAIWFLEKVVKNNPEHAQALNNLGYLYHMEREVDKAIVTFQKLIALDHNAIMASHMLAALTGQTTAMAPDTYIRTVFDSFSEHYDESMVDKLGYSTPAQLREMLTGKDIHRFPFTLDMGCGTGLSGESFQDLTEKLIGLDLSPKMLEAAGKKGFYDSLHETDICSFLRENKTSFDLFLAADVFIYTGDLREIFTLVNERAAAGGLFLFSTELADQGFCLKPMGRYGHAESYIRDLAQETGFSVIKVVTTNIRKEKEEWIAGKLYLLRA
ncbi:MAG: tetratricopeptide repeat protein [Proteobacteria bacterium]|nr:tetratricopeptide repeat protein [Pseudomonadota bacterium]MBU1648595.1 tetratricopeptide repeat protein [Pseudomonadota bacterium]